MSVAISPIEVIQRAFPGIPYPEAEELARAGELHTYATNTILCHENALASTFYVIVKGKVKVSKMIDHQRERILSTLRAGDFFGEMALIHNAPRSATVTTLVPTTVLEVRKDSFNHLLRTSGSLSLELVREVSRRLRENDQLAIEDLRGKAGDIALAYQKLAEQEYARREFLTTIAKELRTPLTAAHSFLNMIQDGKLQGDDLDAALESIQRNLQQITILVNDILFLQELELILQRFHPTNPGLVVAGAVEKYRLPASENGIQLHLQLAPDLPLVLADPKSLERAVKAVLENAIKFSPDGGDINIRVAPIEDEILIEVEDGGVGIPPEALPRIFERFFHLERIGSYTFSGTGIGLSIARQIIEAHRGSISIDSTLGKGTNARVRLPISKPANS